MRTGYIIVNGKRLTYIDDDKTITFADGRVIGPKTSLMDVASAYKQAAVPVLLVDYKITWPKTSKIMATRVVSNADGSFLDYPNNGFIKKRATGNTVFTITSDKRLQLTNDIILPVGTNNINSVDFPSGSPIKSVLDPILMSPVISFGATSTTNIALTWTPANFATSYVLRRSTNSDMSGSVIRYTGSLLGFTDSGLTQGTLYYYQITAIAVGYVNGVSAIYSHTTQYTTGRIFEVGSGNGNLTIDGLDVTKLWYPLQANDTFKVNGGDYDVITYKDLQSPDGGAVIVTANNTKINVNQIITTGAKMNVVIDYKEVVAGEFWGMKLENTDYGGEKFILDQNGAGNFSITVKGVDNQNFIDRGWRIGNNSIPYNNGAGKVAIKKLDVQYCRWTNSVGNTSRGTAIAVFGNMYYNGDDNKIDDGYVETFIFKHNELSKGRYEVAAQNVGYGEVDDITILDINTDVPSSGEGTYHARTLDFFGLVKVSNIKAKNSYGVAIRVAGFNRTSNGTQQTCLIENIISDGNTRYSAVEVNTYEAQQRNWPGVSVSSITKVIGVTAKDLGRDGVYTSVAFDIFGDGSDTFGWNCVTINCYMGGLALGAINGPLEGGSNNVGYLNNVNTKINTTNYRPAADSVLKGTGTYRSESPKDLYGQTRVSPNCTNGAVEAS